MKCSLFPPLQQKPSSDVPHSIPMNTVLSEKLHVFLPAEGQGMLHIYTQVDTVSCISAQARNFWSSTHTLGAPQNAQIHMVSLSQAITK